VLHNDGQAALQYAASEGYAPLRQAVADMLPWNVDARAGAHHHRLAAGPRPGGQGADRPGQQGAGRTPTYLGALQAFGPMEPQPVAWPATKKA
jgi:2-aminoadipate transaminase